MFFLAKPALSTDLQVIAAGAHAISAELLQQQLVGIVAGETWLPKPSM